MPIFIYEYYLSLDDKWIMLGVCQANAVTSFKEKIEHWCKAYGHEYQYLCDNNSSGIKVTHAYLNSVC